MTIPNEILALIKKSKKTITFQVNGFSMLPFISEGDKITVMKIDLDRIKVGDLIVFESNKSFVIHRIIKIVREDGSLFFWEKGDNRKFPTKISAKQVIGKVIKITRSNKEINLLTLKEKIKSRIFACASYLDYLKNTLLKK